MDELQPYSLSSRIDEVGTGNWPWSYTIFGGRTGEMVFTSSVRFSTKEQATAAAEKKMRVLQFENADRLRLKKFGV